jgi:hypothetical protein
VRVRASGCGTFRCDDDDDVDWTIFFLEFMRAYMPTRVEGCSRQVNVRACVRVCACVAVILCLVLFSSAHRSAAVKFIVKRMCGMIRFLGRVE